MRFFEGNSVNVYATPNGPNSGGQILVRSAALFTHSVDIRGDAGNDQGQIILRDTTGGFALDGLIMEGQYASGTSGEGGAVVAHNGEDVTSAEFIGDNGFDAGAGDPAPGIRQQLRHV